MGYYLRNSDGSYYTGDREGPLDIVVTERPFIHCAWNGSSWDYVLVDCQAYQKRKIAIEMDQYVEESANFWAYCRAEVYGGNTASIEATWLAANPGATDAQLPLLAGYAAQMGGGATKADAAAAIDKASAPTLIGKIMAVKADLFAQIDAETAGFDVLQINFDPGMIPA